MSGVPPPPPPPPPPTPPPPRSVGGPTPLPPPPPFSSGAMPPMRSVSELAGDRHSGTNRMSIAALVLGILSIPMCFVFLPAILALGFGIAALVQVSNRPGQSGRRLAVTGIVLGAIGLVLPIVVFFALRDADAAIDMRAA